MSLINNFEIEGTGEINLGDSDHVSIDSIISSLSGSRKKQNEEICLMESGIALILDDLELVGSMK
jgi:hypothetical protein